MVSNFNVTLDPLKPAPVATKLEIAEVRSIRTGREWRSADIIGRIPYERLVRLRALLKKYIGNRQPRLVCTICSVPVNIAASRHKRFFFRHTVETGSCPAITRTGLSESDIRAMKYRGCQESEPHKRLKALIIESLKVDPSFDEILEEKIWRASEGLTGLRRPDVQAMRNNLRIAFEAQLSTTFLQVVVARQEFYRTEKAALVWVLQRFDPNDRRMTIDDILFTNNSNILVVDRETADASIANRKFMLRCHFRIPQADRQALTTWGSRLVPWDDLTVDLDGQRVFAVDVASLDRDLRQRESEYQSRSIENARQVLRNKLIDYVLDPAGQREIWGDAQWDFLRSKFVGLGIDLRGPTAPYSTVEAAVYAILSAEAGKPIGWNFTRLIEVAHHILARHKWLLVSFGRVLTARGHKALLRQQDETGKWERKREMAWRDYKSGHPDYRPDENMVALLSLLSDGRSDG